MSLRPPRRARGPNRQNRFGETWSPPRERPRAGAEHGYRPGAVEPYGPRRPVPVRTVPHTPPAHPRPAVPAYPRRTPEPSPQAPPDGLGKPGAARTLAQFGTMQLPTTGIPSNIHCLTIIGQIEGHLILPPQNKTTKYEHSIPQLVAIELNPAIEGLLVVLNTVGGDVEAGLAIAEMISSLSKPKVSLVVGGGHSIGVPIAVAGDRSFITHTATMTIHPIRLSGLVVGVPQTYEYLDKMQDRVVKFIVANSRISEQRFRDLMFRTGELARDVGTVLVGHDAVRIGLIDEVGGLEEAIAALKKMIAEQRPTADQPGEAGRAAPDRLPAEDVQPFAPAAGLGPATSPGFYPGRGPGPSITPGPGATPVPGLTPGPEPARVPDPVPDDDEAPGPWLPGPETWGSVRLGPHDAESGR